MFNQLIKTAPGDEEKYKGPEIDLFNTASAVIKRKNFKVHTLSKFF